MEMPKLPMTLFEEVQAFDKYYSELKLRHQLMKKHPENYNEEQLDDTRVEWAWTKVDKRLNNYNHDVLEMMNEIINSFIIGDEVLPVYELMKRLDIGVSLYYDIEAGMLVMALRELEKEERVEVIRESGRSISFQAVYKELKDPATPITVDGHGVSKCICSGCQVKLTPQQVFAENGERVIA